MKRSLKQRIVFAVSLLFVLNLLFPFSASAGVWNDPTATPPGDNTFKPIHVGQTHQKMDGTLFIGANNYAGTSTQHGLVVERGFFHIGPPPSVGSPRFTVKPLPGGQVGIGTGDPQQLLDVEGTADFANTVTVPYPSGGTEAARVDFVLGEIAAATSAAEIWLRNSGDPSEIYYSADFVGIGTANPNYDLHIQGDQYMTGGIGIGVAPNTNRGVRVQKGNTNVSYQSGFWADMSPRVTAGGTYYTIAGRFYNRDDVSSGVTNSGYSMGIDASGYLDGAGNLNNTYGARIDSGTGSSGTGVVGNAYGAYIRLLNQGSGTINNAYGIRISSNEYSGTISNGYGVYIGDMDASSGYGIYQAGTNDENYFAGNVGIGTNNPSEALEMQGNIKFGSEGDAIKFVTSGAPEPEIKITDDMSSVNALGIYGGNGVGVVIDANNDNTNQVFQIFKDGTSAELFRVQENGNVGIGTDNPGHLLDVNGTSDFSNTITIPYPSGGTEAARVDFVLGEIAAATSAAEIWLRNSGDPSEIYYDSDFVGIGTNDPGVALHLRAAGNEILRLEDTADTGAPYLSFYQNGTRRSYIQHVDTNDELRLRSEYGEIAFRTGSTEKMVILNNGNVGIGTDNPGSYMAYINGTSYFADDIVGTEGFSVTNGATNVYDDATSNSPYSRIDSDSFHTNGLGEGQIYMEGRAIDSNTYIYIGAGVAGGMTTEDVYLGNNNELVVDTSANSVGIGTNGPGYTLDVDGTSDFANTVTIPYPGGSTEAARVDWVNGQILAATSTYTYWRESGNDIYNENSGGVRIGSGSMSANTKMTVIADGTDEAFIGLYDPAGIDNKRGIKFWSENFNDNWGLYGAQTNTAGAALDGDTSAQWSQASEHALYMRIFDANVNSFILENHSEDILMAVRGGDGLTYFSGNVGIGTDSASARLDIVEDSNDVAIEFDNGSNFITVHDGYGNFNILSGIDYNNNIVGSASGGTRLEFSESGAFDLEVYDSGANLDNRLRINQDESYFDGGSVGINTTNPGYTLEVDGTADFANTVTIPYPGDSTEAARVDFVLGEIADATSAAEIWLRNSGDPSEIYYDSDFVGIGTGNPASGQLHVYRNATTGGWGGLTLGNSTIRVQDSGSNMYIDGNTIYTDGTMNIGNTVASDMTFGTNNTERMRIDSSGNVGIGDSGPDRDLDISSDGQITFGDNVTDDDTSGIYWHAGSNYGIYRTAGTWTSPEYQKLQINWETGINYVVGDEAEREHRFFDDDPSVADNLRMTIGNEVRIGTEINGNGLIRSVVPSGSGDPALEFSDNHGGGDQTWLLGANDAGVGQFEVRFLGGGGSFTENWRADNEGTNFLTIMDSGEVGIGSASPGQSLVVAGQGNFSSLVTVASPVNNEHAATKGYVDTQTGGGLPDPSGSAGNTLYSDGSNWVSSNNIYNNGGNIGIGTTATNYRLMVNGWIGRTAHNNGALVGSYNNIGANSAQTNPIYVIGNNYRPNAADLGSMYGIGYSHTNASFITDPGPNSWGMYVASDGDARVWLAASADGHSYFNAGNVGIGVTSPDTKLHIKQDSFGFLELDRSGGGFGSWILSPSNDFTAFSGKDALRFRYNGSDKLSITSDGDVTTAGGAYFGGDFAIGTSNPNGYKLYVNGDAYVEGNFDMGSGDVAEEFYTDKKYEPGTVLVMSDKGYKYGRACAKEYDSSVIGVISTDPAIVIGKLDKGFRAPVALTGVIEVKVNDSNGLVRKGDLLVTSSIAGQAMSASDPKPGTIIGKALEDAVSESDKIMALVNLQ